jgi:isocitrate dehydrogenase
VGDAKASGTRSFTDAIIANLGRSWPTWKRRVHRALEIPKASRFSGSIVVSERQAIGLDVFVEASRSAEELGGILERIAPAAGFRLKMISNRGTQVFPSRGAETDCVDHWRCRFLADIPSQDLELSKVDRLLGAIQSAGLRWMHLEKLQAFDGKPAFTKAQGED